MAEPKSDLLGKKRPSGEDLYELYKSSSTSSKLSSPPRPTPFRPGFDSSSSATSLSNGLTTNALPPPPSLNMIDGSNNPTFSSFHKFRIGLDISGGGKRRCSIKSIGGDIGGGGGGKGAVGRVSERGLSSKRSRSLCTAADVALLLEVHSAANQGRLGVPSVSSASESGKRNTALICFICAKDQMSAISVGKERKRVEGPCTIGRETKGNIQYSTCMVH